MEGGEAGLGYGAVELKKRLLERIGGKAGKHHDGPEYGRVRSRRRNGSQEEPKKRGRSGSW